MTLAPTSILLSTAVSENKTTTNGYKIIEPSTLRELLHIMNREAVASGLFSNGHRSSDYLKAVGNVYFIDIDTAPNADEEPYYQTIETKLRQKHISFVSVPSKSADTYTYKRHIAIILDGHLPTSQKAFHETAQHILNTLDIDLNKIDKRVAFNNIAFLAPASINKKFINCDDVSTVYEGEPLTIPKPLQGRNVEVTAPQNHIESNQLIRFSDGSTVTAYQAKQIIINGENKSCYCPTHNDNNPSATFYHNSNGSVKIYCGKCGDVRVNTNFIPTIPNILHKNYNYSIILNNITKAKIRALTSKIGYYSHKTDTGVIFNYRVSNIGDIYRLLLAKVYLIQKGFEVSHEPSPKTHPLLKDTSTLQPIIKNITLPRPFIPKGTQSNDTYYQHKQIKEYVFNHYLFIEVTIYATYQNIIAPTRPFNDTCNLGLAYFDYVLQVQEKEKNLKQSDKSYPMRLKGKDKEAVKQQRVMNMSEGKTFKVTARQKKIVKLMDSGEYEKTNGKLNITAIARKLKVSTHTVYADLEVIKAKEKEKHI